NLLESFITDSSMNRTGWDNEEYNDLIAKAKTESDENARWEYMYEAEKLLAEEMPILPIRYYNQVVIQKPDISGIVRHPVGYIELTHADKNYSVDEGPFKRRRIWAVLFFYRCIILQIAIS